MGILYRSCSYDDRCYFFFYFKEAFGQPIIGDIELVQFTMVLLIMGALAITEQSNSHISIGLIVDKIPPQFTSCDKLPFPIINTLVLFFSLLGLYN